MRHIPSLVPANLQNTTALVLRDEMTRRLSKLKTMADWGAMIQELSTSKGTTLQVATHAPTETPFRKTACT
jgi:glycine betaine/choline ABC-type transport system substrate-binding protein